MSASLQEAHDRLCHVEQQHDLLKHQVDGWSAWPLVRFDLSLLLSGLTFPHASAGSRAGRALRALTALPSLWRVRSARHVIKTYSSGLLEESGGRFRDIWFDDVMLAAGSVFKIEAPSGWQFAERSRRAMIPRDISSTVVEAVAAVSARQSPGADVQQAARLFAEVARRDLGLGRVDEAWVRWKLRRFSANRRAYRSILRRVKPSFVLLADPGEHALMAAAKEQRAAVLELQHGIADASNASYGWPTTAARHKARMPIPDRVLLFGEYWRQELDRTGFWGDALRVVGSPRLDRYRQRHADRANDRCTIVFTTQGLDVSAVIRFLQETLQQLDASVPLRLLVKLHPIFDADPTPYREGLAAFRDRVEVLMASEGPSTFELLQGAHLHVSIASASHYDAIGLGVPTVILPFSTHEVVLPLNQRGHAALARTPQELAQVVRTWQNLGVPTEVSEYYFQPGAQTNILRELGVL
jgi:hypothetical protein